MATRKDLKLGKTDQNLHDYAFNKINMDISLRKLDTKPASLIA